MQYDRFMHNLCGPSWFPAKSDALWKLCILHVCIMNKCTVMRACLFQMWRSFCKFLGSGECACRSICAGVRVGSGSLFLRCTVNVSWMLCVSDLMGLVWLCVWFFDVPVYSGTLLLNQQHSNMFPFEPPSRWAPSWKIVVGCERQLVWSSQGVHGKVKTVV